MLAELEKRSTQLYHMAFVALHTGLRATEIFGIRGGDINENDSMAAITAKGGERETVFLPPEVLAVLIKYRTTPDALLFHDKNGKRIKVISDTFNRAADALGLNDGQTQRIWFHTLRHTFGSWLAQSGKVTLIELQRLMRHKRIEMTLHYAHLIPDQQREKLSIISGAIAAHRQSSES